MGGLFSPQAWATVWAYRATFLHGLSNTIQLAVVGLVLALVLGMIFGLFSTSGKKPLAALARVYVEFIQNTPLLLQMCFLYYLLAFSGNSIGILPTGMIALGVYHGAYMSEVIRAGIQSIPKGQYEAGEVLGMTKSQIFFKVTLLQVIKRIVPPMGNEFITLVKDTALVRVISVYEIIWMGESYIKKGMIWPLFYTAVFYLVVNGILTLLFRWAEKKLDYFR